MKMSAFYTKLTKIRIHNRAFNCNIFIFQLKRKKKIFHLINLRLIYLLNY